MKDFIPEITVLLLIATGICIMILTDWYIAAFGFFIVALVQSLFYALKREGHMILYWLRDHKI